MQIYTNSELKQFKTVVVGPQLTPNCPSHIWLDLNSDCNLWCIMCRESLTRKGEFMSYKIFKKIIDQTCHGVNCYSIHNYGETLLLNDLNKYLDYLYKKKLSQAKIDLITNGMFLDEKISRILVRYKVMVTVSFDSANIHTFEKIRRGSDFKKICYNIERFSKYTCDWEPMNKIGIHVAIQQDNWCKLKDIVDFAQNLGVDRISFGLVELSRKFRPPIGEALAKSLQSAILHAIELGMFIRNIPTRVGKFIWSGKEYVPEEGYYIDTTCDAPMFCASIKWNGDIGVCCRWVKKVGNIYQSSFDEIWNSIEYKKIREQVNNPFNMPSTCRKCPLVNRFSIR